MIWIFAGLSNKKKTHKTIISQNNIYEKRSHQWTVRWKNDAQLKWARWILMYFYIQNRRIDKHQTFVLFNCNGSNIQRWMHLKWKPEGIECVCVFCFSKMKSAFYSHNGPRVKHNMTRDVYNGDTNVGIEHTFSPNMYRRENTQNK